MELEANLKLFESTNAEGIVVEDDPAFKVNSTQTKSLGDQIDWLHSQYFKV
jgi:hypothetical protein